MTSPSYDELVARVAELESKMTTGALPLDAIPLQALSDQLAETMVPEGDQHLLPHSTGADSLAAVPNARLRRAALQVIGSAVWTPIQFDTSIFNVDMQWVVATPTRLQIVRPGIYTVNAGGGFTGIVDTELQQIAIQVNGAGVIAGGPIIAAQGGPAGAAKFQSLSATAIWSFAAGDYIELFIYQDSGGNRNTGTTNHFENYLAAKYGSHVEGL